MLKRCLRVMKFDGYAFQARLIPTYIVLLPLAVGLQVWLPEGAILERLGTILVGYCQMLCMRHDQAASFRTPSTKGTPSMTSAIS